MKAYTLSILAKLAGDGSHPIVDKEIIVWVNERLKTAGKSSSITGFNDSNISNGRVVLDLVDAIKPGSVKVDLVKTGHSEQVGGDLICPWAYWFDDKIEYTPQLFRAIQENKFEFDYLNG